ncbi:helix-turn-helix transcriptional regulator [Brevibacillus laterosporus]|uniref:XRE family transcriptional regulator n=1 Tax=Brevibacillus phage Abouo TaxID=1296661 RepID=S5M643_9CAUD|nr:helix-turn-helix transcriptional regulator [Brevibacillus laterosporus]YP_009220108.1 transcriptional repressor [Brevibacillus phage Abouo]AGR47486.1 XRE family transcriptional regulator [Brevibacillus phage Abouo]ATO50102.1 transcriptional regulator [Brevibacillus laterosporus DSM 25]MED2005446.1 helix-turn-helix transcriptional regulator [Brevibacillus laterosporus]
MTKTKPRTSLIALRKSKGFTQQALADLVGINRCFLSNIERGKYSPSLEVAYKIANALDTHIEEIFFGNEVRKTNKRKRSA